MKKVSLFVVLGLVVLLSACSVAVKRPGLEAYTNNKQAVGKILDPKVDYTNGVAPSVAKAIDKNPKATVIISPSSITYVGEGNGAGYLEGVIENYNSSNARLDIRSEDTQVKDSYIVKANSFLPLRLLPGRYRYSIISTDLYDARPVTSELTIGPLRQDTFSPMANQVCDFLIWYR